MGWVDGAGEGADSRSGSYSVEGEGNALLGWGGLRPRQEVIVNRGGMRWFV
jgi:hypothetical protein